MSENFKTFGLYDMSEINVNDAALKPYINIEPRAITKSQGRNRKRFSVANVHILERLANRISVPGHVGKKHKIITNWSTGAYANSIKIVLDTMEIIHKKKNQNPVQILVNAVENASPRDEITTIEYGGARYPQAVDTSPMRRISLALRWIVQGSYQKSFGKKRKMHEALANEIILASDKNMESYAMGKKNEAEKQADAAR